MEKDSEGVKQGRTVHIGGYQLEKNEQLQVRVDKGRVRRVCANGYVKFLREWANSNSELMFDRRTRGGLTSAA